MEMKEETFWTGYTICDLYADVVEHVDSVDYGIKIIKDLEKTNAVKKAAGEDVPPHSYYLVESDSEEHLHRQLMHLEDINIYYQGAYGEK